MRGIQVAIRDPHGLARVALAVLLSLATASARSQVVYSNDFEVGAGLEWTNRLVDRTPSGRGFLGRFTKETIGLNLRDLPAHGALRVAFDLYVIGPWDGTDATNGLDAFDLRIRGGLVLAHSTFSNGPATQNYPDAAPGRAFPAGTASSERNTLGYGPPGDSVYRMAYTFPHASPDILLNFSALSLDFREGESWGVDNVTVTALPSLGPERVANGDFEEPDVPTEYTTVGAGGAIGAWNVASGSVDLTAGYWEAPSGKQSVDLSGTSRGSLAQGIPTAPGETYVLRFAVAGHPLGPPDETPSVKRMDVYWNGALVAPVSFDITGRTTYDMGWRYQQVEVTGPPGASSALLEFRSLTDGFYGPVIDMVSVVAGRIQPAPGDVTGDGKVDLADTTRSVRVFAGLDAGNALVRSLADVSPWDGLGGRSHGDGLLNLDDVRVLLRLSGGLEPNAG